MTNGYMCAAFNARKRTMYNVVLVGEQPGELLEKMIRVFNDTDNADLFRSFKNNEVIINYKPFSIAEWNPFEEE